MKKREIIWMGFLALMLNGCDVIDESNRFIKIEQVKATKSTILEDYTGQKCIYCPNGTAEAVKIKEQYGEHLILVSIHAGTLALPLLSTATGEEYLAHFNIETHPTAVIDRRVVSSDVVKWSSIVRDNIQLEAPLDLNLSCSYDSIMGAISVVSKVRGITNPAGGQKLQLWITESGIKAYQLTPTGGNLNYIHDHVFRAALNGTWGESIAPLIGIENSYTTNYTLNPKWKVANLKIVGFVYNESTYEIQQAAEISVK